MLSIEPLVQITYDCVRKESLQLPLLLIAVYFFQENGKSIGSLVKDEH